MADPPVRIRPRAVVPAGWPPDVNPNQIITAAHINAIRSSVYAWPGDVDGQGHTLSNVHLAGATGVLADPTTTPGDLIARGAAALGRFAIGAAGEVLTVDLAAPAKLKWAAPTVAPVASVFGRAGAVVAQAGDYTVAQVTGAMADPTTTKGDLIARGAAATGRLPVGLDGQVLRADSAQAAGVRWGGESVPSVFGRGGPVVAQAGDYTAAQVTNAVSVLESYPDPAWVTSLAWAKIIGAPASFPPAAHTHDAAAIVSGVVAPARLGTGVADATVYLRGDGTWAAAGSGGGGGVVSVFGRAGSVIAQAGDYTVAQVTGAVADPTTVKGDLIVRNDLASLVRLPVGATGQVLQADTSLTIGMKWTSITGAVQTPWVTDIDAANYQLINARRIGAGLALPAYPLDVVGDINYTGTLRRNGVALAPLTDPTTTKGDLIARGAAAIDRLPAGANGQVLTADSAQALGLKWAAAAGGQTPWTSDIDAAGFALQHAGKIGIGTAPTSLLHLYTNTAGINTQMTLESSATGAPFAAYKRGSQSWWMGVGLSGAASSFDIYDQTAAQFRMTIVPVSGNVGIGTVTAQSRLAVTGASAAYNGDGMAGHFQITTGTGAQIDEKLHIGIVDGSHTWIQAIKPGSAVRNIALQPGGGNVSIGSNTAPAYVLDVIGDVNCSGAFRVAGVAIGTGGISAKNIVTGSRTLNSNYQNTTGKPMFVSVTGAITTGNFMQFLTDAATSPTAIACAMTNGSGATVTLSVSGWVLPGHYYKANVTGTTLSTWVEWT